MIEKNIASAAESKKIDAILSCVSEQDVARLLNKSARHVRDLAQVGDLIKVGPALYDLGASLPKLVEKRASKNADERLRLATEQADNMALKNAALRAEMVSVSDVEITWGGIVRDLRAGVLAIASRIASRLNHLSKDDVLVIDDEIRDALKILGEDEAK